MAIIVGCERSQAVAIAFRNIGIEAFSCDLQPAAGGRPEIHLQMDIFEALKMRSWDLGIFFPPCTFLCCSGNRWILPQKKLKSGLLVGAERLQARAEAKKFFISLYNCGLPKIAVENPVGIMSTQFKKPTQVIQPYWYGHAEKKATCLWLRGLPRLNGFDVVEAPKQSSWKMPRTKHRSDKRSLTFTGIAQSMADQWAPYIS